MNRRERWRPPVRDTKRFERPVTIDRSSFQTGTTHQADDRTLVYHKGAYALHVLRQTLGESLFWSGIREYTRANFGRSVTTADFQMAMEQVSAKHLSEFFSRWVYATTR